LFRESQAFYSEQKASGQITSFESVILSAHGGDLNGLILVKGEQAVTAAPNAPSACVVVDKRPTLGCRPVARRG